MPKIQDIINDLNISREELAAAYKKVIGKALSARAVNLKEDERSLVEKELKHPADTKSAPAKKAAVKAPKKAGGESEEAKVLKSDELFGGDDFLSGL